MPSQTPYIQQQQALSGEWALISIDLTLPWWGDAAGAWGLSLAQLLQHGSPASGPVQGLPQALNALKTNSGLSGLPYQFVQQSALPKGQAYEQFIFDTQCIPTRDGWHDAFNGLVWTRFAATKQRLNHLQAAQIAKLGVGKARGPARDGLTLFDENAVLLQAPPPLWDALLARDWPRLFIDLRPLWQEAQVLMFGHALLEKLVKPYKAITAHVLTVPAPSHLPRWAKATQTAQPQAARQAVDAAWDDWLAQTLSAELLSQKPYTPLPVMGIPQWFSANGDAHAAQSAFYADAQVFRPDSRSKPAMAGC